MYSLQAGSLRSILCLGAHADDIEIGCGGTLLKLLAENPGVDVHWVVLSGDGERADEAANGAERFLANAAEKEVVVKHFRDSFFPYDAVSIKEWFHSLSRECTPDIIFTHRRDDRHQDHRLVSELTWCAFRDHLILEYEIPKFEGDLGQPNIFVPLDQATCQHKVSAIVETYRTQQAKPWFSDDTFWALLRIRGLECHSESRFAEAFECRKMAWSLSGSPTREEHTMRTHEPMSGDMPTMSVEPLAGPDLVK